MTRALTRALVITAEVRTAVRAMRARAAANPLSLAWVKKLGIKDKMRHLKLKDRPPDFKRPSGSTERLDIPYGFTVAYTVEQQPQGVLVGHLSISVDTPGALPHPAAIDMIGALFDISIASCDASWLEEFEPGCEAVNLIKLIRTPASETKQ